MNKDTIRVEIKVNGVLKIVWVTFGNKKDFDTLKFSIDKAYDEVEQAI